MPTCMEEMIEKQIWMQMQDAVTYAGNNAMERDASSVTAVREIDCYKIEFAASRMRANNFSSTRTMDVCGVEWISAGE